MAPGTRGCGLLLITVACGRVGFEPATRDGQVDGVTGEDGVVLRPGCEPAETPGPYTNDFEQGVPAWASIYEISPARMDLFEGALRGRPGTDPGPEVFAGFEVMVADHRERRAFVQVPQMVNLAGCAKVSLVIQDDDAVQYAEVSQSCGVLEALTWVGGTRTEHAIIPYDPVGDRWWQLRAQAGTLHFEVSPDGLRWTTYASTPTPAYFDDAYLELSVGTYQLEAAPIGEARFDDLFDCLAP